MLPQESLTLSLVVKIILWEFGIISQKNVNLPNILKKKHSGIVISALHRLNAIVSPFIQMAYK